MPPFLPKKHGEKLSKFTEERNKLKKKKKEESKREAELKENIISEPPPKKDTRCGRIPLEFKFVALFFQKEKNSFPSMYRFIFTDRGRLAKKCRNSAISISENNINGLMGC